MIKKLCLTITAVAILLSCSKDNDGPTKIDLLTLKSWKIDETVYNGLIEDLQACDAENRWEFTRAGELKIHSGPASCGLPPVINGNWNFQDQETKIDFIFDGGAAKQTFAVLELTTTTFKIGLGTRTIRFEHYEVK